MNWKNHEFYSHVKPVFEFGIIFRLFFLLIGFSTFVLKKSSCLSSSRASGPVHTSEINQTKLSATLQRKFIVCVGNFNCSLLEFNVSFLHSFKLSWLSKECKCAHLTSIISSLYGRGAAPSDARWNLQADLLIKLWNTYSNVLLMLRNCVNVFFLILT